MLGEFKSYQFFVEKIQLANYLDVENLNHLLWGKCPTNYMQQIISKNNKRKQLFQILTIHWCWENFRMINSLLKKSNSQAICMQKIRLEMTVYLEILLQSYP